MQDNSGLNAGDITNGAHTRSTKKNSSSKKNTTTSNEQSDLEKFIQNYQNASAEVKKEIKTMMESDSVLGNFVKQFRSLDEEGQKRVVEKLSDPNNSAAQKIGSTIVERIREIQRPEIQRPEIYDPLGMRNNGNNQTETQEKKKEAEEKFKEISRAYEVLSDEKLKRHQMRRRRATRRRRSRPSRFMSIPTSQATPSVACL